MHILKLKKSENINIYLSDYVSTRLLYLLQRFLEDFADDIGIKLIKYMIQDSFSDGFAGNNSGANKLAHGKLAIFDLYATDDAQIEIDADVLLEVMDLFNKAVKTLPQEIAIFFDDDLRNPCVEIVQ